MSSLSPLSDTALFQPFQLGPLPLSHRVVLAPCTRMRSTMESEGVFVPNDLNVQYYAQRASKGGFMLTEATPINRYAAGYPRVPGIFTASQVAGWRRVTDAVHAKGAYIFCQLWHVGRATFPSFIGGRQALSSMDIPISGKGIGGMEYSLYKPKQMTVEEIQELVAQYASAAKMSIDAGFDGVEIHCANGYLLEQFLHDNINKRTDLYGGSIENRCRFPLEVAKSVTAAIGAERVGIRLSPYNRFQDTSDSDPAKHWMFLCTQIATLPKKFRPIYVHMIEPRYDEVLDEQAKLAALSAYRNLYTARVAESCAIPKEISLDCFRRVLAEGGIAFLVAGNFNGEDAVSKIEAGAADAVAFGRLFIANPDLPRRLKEGLPLNAYDKRTFYRAEPPGRGYVDYPFYD